jgi:hypothetical protein
MQDLRFLLGVVLAAALPLTAFPQDQEKSAAGRQRASLSDKSENREKAKALEPSHKITRTGCLGKDHGSSTPTSYVLTDQAGNEMPVEGSAALENHVGHKVKLTGTARKGAVLRVQAVKRLPRACKLPERRSGSADSNNGNPNDAYPVDPANPDVEGPGMPGISRNESSPKSPVKPTDPTAPTKVKPWPIRRSWLRCDAKRRT